MKLPIANLAPGPYRIELKGMDAVGRSTSLRDADIIVE
jgi:hypothetical protein